MSLRAICLLFPLLAFGQDVKPLPALSDAQRAKYWKAHAAVIAAKSIEDMVVYDLRSACGADAVLMADSTGEPMCGKQPSPAVPKPVPYIAPAK